METTRKRLRSRMNRMCITCLKYVGMLAAQFFDVQCQTRRGRKEYPCKLYKRE